MEKINSGVWFDSGVRGNFQVAVVVLLVDVEHEEVVAVDFVYSFHGDQNKIIK